MAVSDQPVTARGNWYREILIPVIGLGEMTCLNLPHQSASLLSGPPSWSKVLDQPVTARGKLVTAQGKLVTETFLYQSLVSVT